MKIKNDRHIDQLSVFVHGALSALHLLGIVYNLRKHNWLDVMAHSSAVAYDLWAVNKHLEALQ